LDQDALLPTRLDTRVPDPIAGTVIGGRYRVVEPIGGGGMGRVYRAAQLGSVERPVALKLLHASMEEDQVTLRRFENEARIVGQLRHPNTVRLVDAGRTEDGRLFLVTELLFGTRLDRLMADRRLGVGETVRVMLQICGALSEAHRMKIVHRDLKPSNVFLEQVGRDHVVKVLDFGIAKLLDEPGLTRSLTVVGTPGFMSPEQGKGQPLDGRSDLYSLGAIAYECLAGQPTFTATSRVDLLYRQVTQDPPPLHGLVDRTVVPAELSLLVMQLLSRDPAQRPPSAEVVAEWLERILPQIAAEASPASAQARDTTSEETTTELAAPVAAGAPPSAIDRRLIVLLAVPVLLLIAAASFWPR
jgi:serine/threonine-protein kinase